MEAVRCEKAVYEAASTSEAGFALERKARCYAAQGLFEDACSTLERIALFSIPPTERAAVLMEKTVLHAIAGNIPEAAANLEEANAAAPEFNTDSASDSALVSIFACVAEMLGNGTSGRKTYEKAFLRSFFPPLAHIYVGKSGEGILRAAGDLAAVGLGVAEALSGNWWTAFLAGGIGLYESYWKGNASLEEDVVRFNKKSDEALSRRIRDAVLPGMQEWLAM